MSEGIVRSVVGTLLLLLMSCIKGDLLNAQENSVRFMFYNVENLFDTYDDTLTNDDEFLPWGIRGWDYERYDRKLNSIYKTIVAAGEWSPPAIIAFCETENRKVLEDLVLKTGLSNYNYSIIHEDSPDPRGIDVCMIYRREFVDIIHYHYFLPESILNDDFPTRNILYVKCLALNDTLHLFINHWPSRRGGVLPGEYRRRQLAEMLRIKVDSIASAGSPDVKIIIAGDFNLSPDDRIFDIFTGSSVAGQSFINMSGYLEKGTGTYRYRGVWDLPDQLIITSGLLKNRKGIFTKPKLYRIFKPLFLLRSDPLYPGLSPFSTWSGYKYNGGYSDHLPLLLDIIER